MDATSSLVISDVTPCSGLNLNNLLVIPTQNVNSVPCQLCFCLHNTRLVGSAAKRVEITNFIKDHDVDVQFITETWLQKPGDEAKCMDLAPQGYKVYSFPCSHCSTVTQCGGITLIIKDCPNHHCSNKSTFLFLHTSFDLSHLSMEIQQQ